MKKVRGVKDILPEEASKIQFVVETCKKVVAQYGFKEVILPTIENLQIYQHSIGQTTDIVEKQMFYVTSHSFEEEKQQIVLRPEGTAGIVRMYIENNLRDKYPLRRFYYFGPMFRYERPQKGRYREFYQFGIEIFGEAPVSSDFILIKIINQIFSLLKIETVLEVNSIGCKNCRISFVTHIQKELDKIKELLCDVCKVRIKTNPLRVLDCKTDIEKIKGYENKFNILNFICDKCKKEFNSTLLLFDKNKIEYKIVPTLVRGLDYYNGFVFEYKSQLFDAAQNTLCAGGRYDGLIQQYDKNTMYACGAAFGINRVVDIVKDSNYKNQNIVKIGIATVNDEYLFFALNILSKITKSENIVVIGPFSEKSLKSQLRLLNKEGTKFVLIVGEEIKNNKVVIKNFVENKQEVIEVDKIEKMFTNQT